MVELNELRPAAPFLAVTLASDPRNSFSSLESFSLRLLKALCRSSYEARAWTALVAIVAHPSLLLLSPPPGYYDCGLQYSGWDQ